MRRQSAIVMLLSVLISGLLIAVPTGSGAVDPPDPDNYEAYPPFLSASVPPVVMLVMGKDHKLFYEAYNDASDLDGDGVLDITYKPDSIDYYGYFDSHKYYEYDGTNGLFLPRGMTVNASGDVDGIGKMAPSGNYWSGDFLNYLTMSRMDTLRRVLYGGKRSTDTATETVLERAYIPQDAHSWGKEYESVAANGYDIRNYTPLALPETATRHLFASTSLADYTSASYNPLLRVLPNNPNRIWDWVAKEGPVCDSSLVVSAGTTWEVVPPSSTAGISDLTKTTYSQTIGHPADHDAFVAMINSSTTILTGPVTASIINWAGDAGSNYLTIFEGNLNVPADGTYTFSVDGDDAVEFVLPGADDVFNTGDDNVVASWYGGHSACNCNTRSGSVYLTAGTHRFQFHHEEVSGSDSYYLRWQLTTTDSQITDYVVRVKVADTSVGVEDNCKQYPDGDYKPIGLLQRHGESNGMYFGLMTGSYAKNMAGGVVRKAIGSITDEIDTDTGRILTGTNGIIKTIDKIRIYDFSHSNHQYAGGWLVTSPMSGSTKKFPDWGNPVAEMMYEALRYFADGGSATADYTYSGTTVDATLGLPLVNWTDPFVQLDEDGNPLSINCAKPIMLVISDINTSYDSDQLPGSAFAATGWTSGRTLGNGTLNVQSELAAISTDVTGSHFIGQVGSTYDSSCSAKTVNGLANVRGLCPEEPTKEGGYYAGAVAHYGRNTDMRADLDGAQKVSTYAVALSSPLPKIEIPVGSQTVTLTPFGKTVYTGVSGFSNASGSFQPTCTIVDFFVEEIAADNSYGRFRINYEDVEQGADHDMDVIVRYEYEVQGDDTIKITLTKEYEGAGYVLHLGYIISGTTRDGIYLEVASQPTNDVRYYMDTPTDRDEPGRGSSTLLLSNGVSGDATVYSRERTFTPSSTPAATMLDDPLWYAAKWGGTPEGEDWDKDGDGTPDTYYYVVNPLELEEKLNKTFRDIAEDAASGTASSVLANNSEGESSLLQAFFKPKMATGAGDIYWLGYMQSLWVDPWGNIREDTNGNHKLDLINSAVTDLTSNAAISGETGEVDMIIEYAVDDEGDTVVHRYTSHYRYHPSNSSSEKCVIGSLGFDCDNLVSHETKGLEEISPIFEVGEKLHQRSPDDRKIFTFIDGNGEDDDGDGLIDESGEEEVSGAKWVGRVTDANDNPFTTTGLDELIPFSDANWSRIRPFLGVRDATAWSYLDRTSSPNYETRTKNLINYIRGEDSADLIGGPSTRSRTLNGNVWKLGDIVNSTPVSISSPPDSYHLIYGDASFQNYLNHCKGRETAVYVGANDGMLHAFTSWKYDASTGTYTQPSATTEALGDELWAYIPQALLPHLKFLANPEYAHSYYVDMKPKVFDAQIFDNGSHFINDGGWGTILLVGLNMGGKRIWAESDFDGDSSDVETRYFNPTYICMDVTDPRNPRLLWERSYENLAMTTSSPTIVAVGKTRFLSGTSYSWSVGKWLAVFGSGPTEYDGSANQNGYIFAIDLKTGKPYRSSGGDEWLFDTGSAAAAMNSPVSYDHGLNYNVDGVYFGSAIGASGGKVYKIDTRVSGVPSDDPTKWNLTTMFDAQGPISAPLSLSTDSNGNAWVFFGTGRYLSTGDKLDTEQRYFFGVKDSFYRTGTPVVNLDMMTDLFDASPYTVYTNQAVTNSDDGSTSNWNSLVSTARGKAGWYNTLETLSGSPSERVISKATVLGGIVFFPAYTPNSDICGFGGDTNYYGLYYETGTAYHQHVFPTTATGEQPVNIKYTAGHGAPPPAAGFHIGRESGGTAFLQMSTGEVVEIDVETAFPLKSNLTGWRDKSK